MGLWWLGQNGYIFKSHEGTLVSTDLYLTDSCHAIAPPGMSFSRQVPVLIPPEEIDVDLYCCTHNHQDHTDPETIARLRHRTPRTSSDRTRVAPCLRRWASRPGGSCRRGPIIWWKCATSRSSARSRWPTDDTDLNHMGFVFEFAHGPRIYMTGDTADCELLASAGRHAPHLMITCINGGFKNLSHDQAAILAGRVRPARRHPLPLRHVRRQLRGASPIPFGPQTACSGSRVSRTASRRSSPLFTVTGGGYTTEDENPVQRVRFITGLGCVPGATSCEASHMAD